MGIGLSIRGEIGTMFIYCPKSSRVNFYFGQDDMKVLVKRMAEGLWEIRISVSMEV